MSEFRLDQVDAATNAKQSGLDLLSVSQENQEPKATPVARFTLLAGTVAGLTELTFSRLNKGAAQTLADATGELMTGNVSINAVDKLTGYRSSVPSSEFGLTLGGVKESTQAAVTDIITATDRVRSATGTALEANNRFGLAKQALQAEVSKLSSELQRLQDGSFARHEAMDVMHSERYALPSFDGTTGVNADQLRKMATESLPQGNSTLRTGLLDRASRMLPGETISPRQAVSELLPEWNSRLQAINAENVRVGDVTEKLGHLDLASRIPDRASMVLQSRARNGFLEPVFPAGDPARAVLTELQQAEGQFRSAAAHMERESSQLRNLSGDLNRQMHAELAAEKYAVNAFGRGFGKGVLAMSAGVGVGCVIDGLTGEERSTLNSPIGMGLDAGAGLLMVSNLPAKYKLPLAVATMAVPRVLNAFDIGPNQLAPSSLSSSSIWAPNAIDGIGLGLAVSLPVDGRVKAAAAGAAIVAGRAYNAYNYKPADRNLLRPY
ncbi:MAG: hypothetical protein K2W95_18630 [Candidatus Obscuribacterales bacterium]|nr:hypothetical protein [Candidatus Obscuribacterales bacterium]